MKTIIGSKLCFEGNYLIWVFNKIKLPNIENPYYVSIATFFLGWRIPCILASFSGVLFHTENVKNACFLYDLTMYAFFVISLPLILNMEHHISAILDDALSKLCHHKLLSILLDKLCHSVERTNRRSNSSILHITSLVIAYIVSISWIITLLIDNKPT